MKKLLFFATFLVWLAVEVMGAAANVPFSMTKSGTERKILIETPLDITVADNLQLSLEWKCTFAEPVRYVVFAFQQNDTKREVFVYFGDSNAISYFMPDKWYKISIPVSELKPLSGDGLKAGDKLTFGRFWAESKEGNAVELSIRNLQFSQAENAPRILEREPAPIQVWPRQEPVCWPTKLAQFVVLELPETKVNGELNVGVTLPEKVQYVDAVTGSYPTVPNLSESVTPVAAVQNGNQLDLTLPNQDYSKQKRVWIPLLLDVQAEPGIHKLDISVHDAAGATVHQRSFKVKVYPELNRVSPKNSIVAVWYFTGLDSKFVPDFMRQLTAAGVNSFYSMEGEIVDGKTLTGTVADYAAKFKTQQGVAFFTGKMLEYYATHPLPPEAENVELSLQHFVDNPAAYKAALQGYLHYLTAGKPHQMVIYDAESGAIKRGKIVGDLTEYNRKKFSSFVHSDTVLTPEQILADYPDEWVQYHCDLSNLTARLTREAMDEDPALRNMALTVYSGYEYDEPPYRDMTRKNYGVDWKSMRNMNIQYAGAGYQGTMKELRHMDDVLSPLVKYIPAEVYIWNYESSQIGGFAPDRWKMRLMEAYLNSGMHGVSVWQAHVLDGSALVALSEFSRWAAELEALGFVRSEVHPDFEHAYNLFKLDSNEPTVLLLNTSGHVLPVPAELGGGSMTPFTSKIIQ